MGTYGKEIHSLMKAVDAIRGDAEDMSAQQVQTVLAIALRPGLTTQDLMTMTGMEQSSASRNTKALSKWHRLDKPGYDLIERNADPRNEQRMIYHLNHNGRQRVKKALEAISGEPAADFESPGFKDQWKR
jgi:DNA-binding MarR family transcriptional regulator